MNYCTCDHMNCPRVRCSASTHRAPRTVRLPQHAHNTHTHTHTHNNIPRISDPIRHNVLQAKQIMNLSADERFHMWNNGRAKMEQEFDEQGGHDALLAQNGLYSQLVSTQLVGTAASRSAEHNGHGHHDEEGHGQEHGHDHHQDDSKPWHRLSGHDGHHH